MAAMIRQKTVLILGAGASHPYGFPLGFSLLGEIRNKCVEIQKGGLREECASYGRPIELAHVKELIALIDRPCFTSIDALLEQYEHLVPFGKFLIAISLMPCESPESLFSSVRRPTSWYEYLFHKMEGQSLDEFRANEISFITFNYDRSLEFYLREAVKTRYAATEKDVDVAMGRIHFVHVHGSLGTLGDNPYTPANLRSGLPFIRRAADSIKIIHEVAANTAEFQQAHTLLDEAEKVGILGFGFLDRNVQRLKLPSKLTRFKQHVLATAVGMSEPERNEFTAKIVDCPGLKLFHDFDCYKLVKHTYLLFNNT